MTHHKDPELLNTVLQLLTSQGPTHLLECFRLLLNEAMLQERSTTLQAQPFERCEERLGHANGFKPKTLSTRMGEVELRIPQVRDGIDFYPSALERGVRSEQALTLAMAEMYVQGVSTRKVSTIVEKLCGHSVSSSQVSACAAKLDVELKLWREQPLGAYPYLIFDARYEKVRQGGLLVDCAVLIAMGLLLGLFRFTTLGLQMRAAAFAPVSEGLVLRKSLNQCVKGCSAPPTNSAPTASTMSGIVIDRGDSCAWCPASSGTFTGPQKVRKYARNV